MTMGYRHSGTPWIYRSIRQMSEEASRRWLVAFLLANVVIAGFVVWSTVVDWNEMPANSIPGAILVGLAGLYAVGGLIMLAFNKHIFD